MVRLSLSLGIRSEVEEGTMHSVKRPCRFRWWHMNQKGRTDQESRLRKSEQGDKWSFCLTAGKIGPRIRRDDEQTSTPESFTGLQGEGGAGSHQGRPDDSPTGRAFRRSR